MTYLFGNIFLLFALAGGETHWYDYPGWEVWRFVNLLLFVGVLFWLLRRPVGASLVARRDAIRQELMRAQEERRAALAKLEEVEARLAKLDAEVERAGKVARQDLRRYAAEQSVRLAEDMIRRDIRAEDDARLMNEYIGDLGGIKG